MIICPKINELKIIFTIDAIKMVFCPIIIIVSIAVFIAQIIYVFAVYHLDIVVCIAVDFIKPQTADTINDFNGLKPFTIHAIFDAAAGIKILAIFHNFTPPLLTRSTHA
jgi:acetaldehyde dehydrogenase (acetylating)